MLRYLDDRQERFFTWCDKVVQDYIAHNAVAFKAWWPRKNPAGSYELVLELVAHDKTPFKASIPIPQEFHALLEREYFIDHPPDKDDE